MKLAVDVKVTGGRGGLDLGFAQDAKSLRDAINEAVVRQTDETKNRVRAHVLGAMGTRAAFTIRSKVGLDRRAGADEGSVVGVVSSNWKRRTSRGRVYVLDVFENGAIILPRGEKYLAIPLPAAGKDRKGRKLTPVEWEAENNQDLQFVPRKGGRAPLLVAQASRLRRNGRAGFTRRRGTAAPRYRTTIPIFVLVRSTRIQKRLNVGPIKADADERFAEKVIISMAKRGIGD